MNKNRQSLGEMWNTINNKKKTTNGIFNDRKWKNLESSSRTELLITYKRNPVQLTGDFSLETMVRKMVQMNLFPGQE